MQSREQAESDILEYKVVHHRQNVIIPLKNVWWGRQALDEMQVLMAFSARSHDAQDEISVVFPGGSMRETIPDTIPVNVSHDQLRRRTHEMIIISHWKVLAAFQLHAPADVP